MSDLQSQLLAAFQAVKDNVRAPESVRSESGPERQAGPRGVATGGRVVTDRPRVSYAPVVRRPVASVAVDGSGVAAVFLRCVAPGAVLVRSFPAPVSRALARRVYQVYAVYEFHGVSLACATCDGALVTEAGKLHKLAALCR